MRVCVCVCKCGGVCKCVCMRVPMYECVWGVGECVCVGVRVGVFWLQLLSGGVEQSFAVLLLSSTQSRLH